MTYDTKHVPLKPSGYMSLDKTDIQKFFKKLRKHPDNHQSQIRYYCVGEYGSKTNRPHYHVILFNATIPSIEASWKLGTIHYAPVNGATIGYTLKYISKTQKIPFHTNDDRERGKALMSKGLGSNYLAPNMIKWHKANKNERMYCNLPDGKKISMPRYYKDKMYSTEERKAIGYHARKLQLKELEKNLQDPMYFRNKAEATIQAFRNMKNKESQNEKI